MLLARVSQEDIMSRYFGPFRVGPQYKYKNPFRKDSKAGCHFAYNSSGSLRFVDYATEQVFFDCFAIAHLATGLPFHDLISAIYNDMKVYANKIEIFSKSASVKLDTDIRTRLMMFDDFDVNYFGEYGITLPILDYFDVKKCEKVWINGRVWKSSKKGNPIYRYRQKDRFKIYLPFEKKEDKFRTNYYGGLLDGWMQLPVVGDLVFLLKGYKDVMAFYALGDTSVGVRSETTLISLNALNLLKARFKFIIPWMDNDETGKQMLIKYQETYGLKGICNPDWAPKDPSDWIKKNKTEFLQWRNGLEI